MQSKKAHIGAHNADARTVPSAPPVKVAGRSSTRAPNPHDDSGAAAVEFALLFPLFAMLVFGMLWGGVTFQRWIEVTQGARETSRYGATLPVANFTNVDAWLAEVVSVAKESAGITSSTASSDYYVCVAFENRVGPNSTPASKSAKAGTLPVTHPTPCTGSALDDNVVEVLIARRSTFDWIFGGGDLNVTGSNTSRYEPVLKTD